MPESVFKFDLTETFPRLSRAPIVEAVIHWQARAQKSFDPDALTASLAKHFPDYASRNPIQRVEWNTTVSDGEDPPVFRQRKDWLGMRLKSDDGHYAVQFERDGLVFSRVNGYDHWEPFVQAAKVAWNSFLEIAAPLETQRLGVRFINHIPAATPETLGSFLLEPPSCPSNLPLKEFVYQSTFAVPGHPYNVRLIKVMQPPSPELQASSGLFVDLDVFATNAIPNEPSALDQALTEMRWLKNKVFFSLMTPQALDLFR